MFYVYATDIAHKDFNKGVCLGRFDRLSRAKNVAKYINRVCGLVETMIMNSTDEIVWCSYDLNN